MSENHHKKQRQRHAGTNEKSSPRLYLPDGTVIDIEADSGRSGCNGRLPTREIDFEQLPDGRRAEIVEDPDDPKRTLLVVGRDDSFEVVESIRCEKEILVPLSRQDELLRSVTLPRGVEEVRKRSEPGFIQSDDLVRLIFRFIRESIATDDLTATMLTFFAVSTWFVDRFIVAPYLLVTGPPVSGKTTLLKVLGLFCRRPLLIGDTSSAALYRIHSRIHPTLLLDESATQIGQSTSALRHLLRVGSTRQGVARNGEIFDCFGAKVITALEPPNDPALVSRCIPMKTKTAIPQRKDLDGPEVQVYVDKLRQSLLRWRLNQWSSIRPVTVPGAESFSPRMQDLLSRLAAAASSPMGHRVLLAYFKRIPEVVIEDRPTLLKRLLNSILSGMIHARINVTVDSARTACVLVKNLTNDVNEELGLRSEQFQLSPEEVGHLLTALGLNTRDRTSSGMRLWLDLRTKMQIHLNQKHIGQEKLLMDCGPQIEKCPLCEEILSRL
jgi:hypothetical protein